MFQGIRDWWERQAALRELEAADRQETTGFSKYLEDEMTIAKAALDAGDRDQALGIWRKASSLDPKWAMTSKQGLNVLLGLGCFDEAEVLIQKGLKQYPGDARVARGGAEVAYRRGDFPEALRRCERLRRRFPYVPEGYTIAAVCLSEAHQLDDGERMIERAVSKCPNDFDVLVEHAEYAARRQDWASALRRWQAISDRFDSVKCPLGVAQSLRQLGRYAEAEAIAREASEKHAGAPWVYIELALIALAKGDIEAEIGSWNAARSRCPFFAIGYTSGAAALRRAGRDDEADEVLGEAITRLRWNLDIHLDYARSAPRGDPTAALERWRLVRERFSDCEEAREQEAAALANSRQ